MLNDEERLAYAAEYIDRTTPENFPTLRQTSGAFLLSMLSSDTINSALEQLSAHSQRGGQNWVFKSFGMGIEKYFSGEYFDVLAFAIQHKNEAALKALATAIFDGSVQFWYGSDMRINSGLYTDQGHITDQGLFMYSGLMDTQAVPGEDRSLVSNLVSVSIMMAYRLDDEEHLVDVPRLARLDDLISRYQDFIPFIIPARCMFFFAQQLNLYLSETSHLGTELESSPFDDPEQMAVIRSLPESELAKMFSKVNLSSSTIIQSKAVMSNRTQVLDLTVRGDNTRFVIQSGREDISDIILHITCPIYEGAATLYFYKFYIDLN